MGARRTKGDGGLYQRADGVWIGRVELPPGRDGKRRQRTVSSRSFDTAAARLRKLRADVDDGRIAVTGNTTVSKWLDRWITEIHAQRIRPTTLRDYQMVIEHHINPTLGTKRLDKLTLDHIRQMHRVIGPRRAAEKAHVILQRALKDAVREGMITRNVAELVDKPRYNKTKRTSLSVDLAKRIIGTGFASRDKSEATRWAAAFLTGCRQGELLGLEWDRVDLEHGVMEVSWQLQQLDQAHGCGEPVDDKYPCGRERPGWCPQAHWDLPPGFDYRECHRSLVWTLPKTAAGARLVPIIPDLLAKLRELHTDQGVNPHGLVWHYPDGRPIGPREDYKAWKALLVDAKVIKPKGETLPLHVARHTTATLLRASGVDEQTRMEILGHATVDSQRVYAHGDRQRHLSAMTNLNQLLAPAD
jgi:integrase